MIARAYFRGAPPHIGWWATTYYPKGDLHTNELVWRWSNGMKWTLYGFPESSQDSIRELVAIRPQDVKGLYWTYYWPRNGKVERVNPITGEVTGRIRPIFGGKRK